MRPEIPLPPFPIIAKEKGVKGKFNLFKLMTLLNHT